MPIEFSEDLFQNDDFKVETDNNGNLVQTHKQTGAEFLFNATKNRWVPVQGLDLEGATIDNIGSLDSSAVDHDATTNKTHDGDSLTPQSIDVGSLSATQLAQALNANGNDISNVGSFDAGSVNTDEVETAAIIANNTDVGAIDGIQPERANLADDEAKQFTATASLIFISSRSDAVAAAGFGVRFSGITTLFNSSSSVSNQGNTTLSGTTGPNGFVNVAVDQGDIYVENRTGTTEDIMVTGFGR